MTVKNLIVALASIVAIAAASDRATAQVVLAPKFTTGGAGGYRGPFPGFANAPKGLATNIQPATPTVIYSVSGPNGIVTPASYLGSNLGQSQNTTYQLIVSSNSITSLTSNNGQQGNFGNLGSQGQIGQGGQIGQIGQGGQIGQLGGGVGGKLGGGGGGAIGGIGALGSRYYGI